MFQRHLGAAVVGTGFMARTHLEALRRTAGVEIAAVIGRRSDRARALAEEFGAERVETSYAAVLAASDVHAVHVCTPNAQHFAMASTALNAGKHVLCEKPLATSAADAAALVAIAAKRNLRHATCYNLRTYPLVQQMRRMRETGALGDVLIAQGTYSQDWLLYESDWNWRVDAREAGPLRAMGDIGTHWCDMLEHVSGLTIRSVCADLATFHARRERPPQSGETFGAAAGAGTSSAVDTEDFGSMLFHLGDRARGAVTVSQTSAGRKNSLRIEINGTKASVAWTQDRPDELWIGRRDNANEILLKDPSLLLPGAAEYADYPGGHGEGYSDTFKQVFRRFYQSIREPAAACDYPTFADGLRQIRILDAALASHKRRGWVDVERD